MSPSRARLDEDARFRDIAHGVERIVDQIANYRMNLSLQSNDEQIRFELRLDRDLAPLAARRPLRRRLNYLRQRHRLSPGLGVEGQPAQVLDDFADADRAFERALDQRLKIRQNGVDLVSSPQRLQRVGLRSGVQRVEIDGYRTAIAIQRMNIPVAKLMDC